MPSADLGGLGPTAGQPDSFLWTSNYGLRLLPWLGLLGLLLLKSNRRGPAWWIWVSLLCCVMLEALLSIVPEMDSRAAAMFSQLLDSLAFGLAALWLLSPYLARMHRFLTFLASLGVVGCFAVLTFACGGPDWRSGDSMQLAVVVALCVPILCLALSLAFLLCRRRYSPWRLLLWTMLFLLGICALTAAPFVLAERGRVSFVQFMGPVLIVTGLLFGLLLPFFLLSFLNGFYRERLKDLLRVPCEVPPPIPAMTATPSLPAGRS